ncbi:MAG: hypothetical protein ABIY56_07280 [Dokdonella sp.]
MTAAAPASAAPVRRYLLRQPAIAFSVAYVLTSLLGMWGSYWYYREFGIPILAFLQAPDYVVAGLHDPVYFAIALGSVLLAWMLNLPLKRRQRDPEAFARMQASWGWRLMYPRWLYSGSVRTGISTLLGVVWMILWIVLSYAQAKARADLRGDGPRVELALIAAPASQTPALLLGSTSSYVLVYWPELGRAEAIPLTSVSRMGFVPPRGPAQPAAQPQPAADVGSLPSVLQAPSDP